MSEDIRIYVVVAEEVEGRAISPNYSVVTYSVCQPNGRIAAQVGHVLAKLQRSCPKIHIAAYKTIVLSARNEKELRLLLSLLSKADQQPESFIDCNEEAYGAGVNVLTSICTPPVRIADVQGILDHLPLWKGTAS